MSKFLAEIKIDDVPDLAIHPWNADETGFSLAVAIASRCVLARRGSKAVHETAGGTGREYVTVLGCGSADGSRLSPYTLYEGVNPYRRRIVNGLAETLYSVSKSRWMEADNFLQCFLKLFVLFVSHLLSKVPVILLVDGHLLAISQDCKREGNTFILSSSSYGTHTPAFRCWCLWSCQASLEKLIQNRNISSKCN